MKCYLLKKETHDENEENTLERAADAYSLPKLFPFFSLLSLINGQDRQLPEPNKK